MQYRLRNAALLALFLVNVLFAEDWPAWRHDAARSGVTSESLPTEVHLLWSRDLGRNHTAWPEDVRLQFDASYEPIVVGQKLVVASARNHTVAALDTQDGEELWKFFVGGPVRLAPFAHRDHVYFGADDGKLYCLDIDDGKLVWSIDAAPSERLVLGNERLISVWPARGGVAIAGEKLLFTVGIWPFEGSLLCQVNVDGRPPSLKTRVLDDLAPQGYLAISEGRLFIPGGRATAACFDLTSLDSVSFGYSSSRGTTDTHVAAPGSLLVHGDAIYDFDVGQQMDFRLRWPLVDDQVVYGTRERTIEEKPATERAPAVVCAVRELAAYDLARREDYERKDRRGETVVRYRVPEIWSSELDEIRADPEQPKRLMLKAANQLMGRQGDTVFCVLAGREGAPQLLWQREFAQTPTSVLAADGKLFIVTDDGVIHCYGGTKQTHPAHVVDRKRPVHTVDSWTRKAREALLFGGDVRGGHCIVAGIESGQLVEEILHRSNLQVVVVEPSQEKVDVLRQRLDALGLYGSRATAIVGHATDLSWPPYMASLIVSEHKLNSEAVTAMGTSMYRVLRPYGGSAVFEVTDDAHRKLDDGIRGANLPGAKVTRSTNGKLTKLTREGALPGAADWTHEYGDSANTLMSQDTLVKAPFGVLWFGGPSSHGDLYFNRHYWGPGLTVVEGRMILQGPQVLTSVDIYTGRVLWQKQLREGSGPGRRGNFFEVEHPGFHYVATADAVYLVYPDVCLVIDPESGDTQAEITLPDGEDRWGKIRVWNNLLLVTVFRPEGQRLLPKAVCAVDRHKGDMVWRQAARTSVPMMAVGGDRVFCFDGYLSIFYDAWRRRGSVPKSPGYRALRSFDAATGDEVWQRSSERVATWLAYSPEYDTLVVSNKEGLDAFRGRDGEQLWKKQDEAPGFGGHPENVWDKVILSDSQIIDQRGPGKAYDIATGKPVMHVHPITGEKVEWAFTKTGHHCNYAIASPNLLTFRAHTAGFFDRATCSTGRLNGFRSGCRNSLIPAGGVLNAPNYAHGCACNYNLFTSLALVHVAEADMWTYNALPSPNKPFAKLGINLGAPGDRMDDTGTLWIEYPTKSAPSATVSTESTGALEPFHVHPSQVRGDAPRWIAGSGVEGLTTLKIPLPTTGNESRWYNVQLYFLEPEDHDASQRLFDVKLQGALVLKNLDIFQEAGGARWILVKKFDDVSTQGSLELEFDASRGKSLLCGVGITPVQ